ncbi:hypothetical protein ACI2I2_20060 [Scandinavium sp. NPDC088450]|uniref:hypothetical protein n=1 Tax=Scandinavium sp. NPDC088450 TaxID=3364514 RepID=UPI00384C790C
MNTRNVNVKTAAPESSRKMEETPVMSVDAAHELALVINAELDEMVSVRMHISNCSYEGMEFIHRLDSWVAFPMLKDRKERYDIELLRWIRKTAQVLWENGYLPEEYRNEEE